MIRLNYSISDNIRDDLGGELIPLLELSRDLAEQIRRRVHDEGLAGDGGPWSPYASKKKPPKRGDRFYWTRVGEPQPVLHRIQVARNGARSGRAAYPSYAHYREALGAVGNQKRFLLTGELRDSMVVMASRPSVVTITYPNRLRKAAYGRAKSGKPFSNQKVAQFAFRTERMSPMEPTDAEITEFSKRLVDAVPPALLKQVQLAELEAKATRRARSLTRSANRLLSGAGIRV